MEPVDGRTSKTTRANGTRYAHLHLHWEVPPLPLKGGEIVQRGVGRGPEVARILQAVEGRWIAEGFPDRARVETILDEELASR